MRRGSAAASHWTPCVMHACASGDSQTPQRTTRCGLAVLRGKDTLNEKCPSRLHWPSHMVYEKMIKFSLMGARPHCIFLRNHKGHNSELLTDFQTR